MISSRIKWGDAMNIDTTVHSSSLDGRPRLGVVTKRAYRLRQGKLARGEPAALVREPIYRDVGGFDAALILDSDLLGLHKPATDVLLAGCAHSRRGAVDTLHTALAVGAVRKDVLVTGDRNLEIGRGGSLKATRPQPFERMPLGWDRAYGGRDVGSETKGWPDKGSAAMADILTHAAHSYPRNRCGVGFFVDRERQRLDGAALPNLSDPGDPIELARMFAADPCDWLDRPTPAGYGPVGPLTFPRCWFYGVGLASSRHARPVREVALGVLGEHEAGRIDDPHERHPRAFNCAPPGLATTQLRGDERVELYNLHRDAEHFVFELPGERPRLLVEPPNAGTFELEPRLTTVFIEPDEDRVTLTWSGSTPAAGIYAPEMCATMRHAAIWT